MSENHSRISSFIWNICDDVLRGLFKEHEYGDIILPFCVFRRLDCVLESSKDDVHTLWEEYNSKGVDPTPIIINRIKTKFFNRSKYDLKRLIQDPDNINLNFSHYINGFSENIYEIIENFEIEKPVKRLQEENLFFMFVDKLTEIDLHPNIVDNRQMGLVYEELIRISSEKSNQKSGEHFTPRDIVNLLVSLMFCTEKEKLKGKGLVRGIFDPCCGTGGMLTIGSRWIQENINPDIQFRLCGQELNPQTYSICKSDFLITGYESNDIRKGSSLSKDKFSHDKFEYLITNPPFGDDWKKDKDEVLKEHNNSNGRFSVGYPRIDDGSLLFLQHMVSKMEPSGSRIGIVFNGSPLYSGDSGSGESNIRKWIIENDLLECIVQLPDQMFFRTDIITYLWILNNKKTNIRRGKIQLLNCKSFYISMDNSLGKKRKTITNDQISKIVQLYLDFDENKYSKIFPNNHFGYTRVTIERPLIENGEIHFKTNGKPKPNSKLRDVERIPLQDDIDEYLDKEVTPFLRDSWFDRSKDRIGYEINFTLPFYIPNKQVQSQKINQDLKDNMYKTFDLLKSITNR